MAQSPVLIGDPIPKKQTALVGTVDGGLALTPDAGVPHLEGDMVLVRTQAVSVNPVDTKMVGDYITPGAIAGCDFAGTVVAVGSEAAATIKKGERVCGAVMGMNPLQPDVGAFAAYVGARANRILCVPPSMSCEAAAAMSTSFMTAGLALFKSLGLPGSPRSPVAATSKPVAVLVNGGATATGTAALQLLHLSGYRPIATCSPGSSALAASFGAEATFDYRDPGCAAAIRAYTNNSLRYALDCITTVDSMKLCYAALGRIGGRYTALDPFPEAVALTRKVVKPDWVLGPIMLGKDIGWPEPHGRPADDEMSRFGVEWVQVVQELLDKDRIKHHPIEVKEGGIGGILHGMSLIREHKVSGKKLVYVVEP